MLRRSILAASLATGSLFAACAPHHDVVPAAKNVSSDRAALTCGRAGDRAIPAEVLSALSLLVTNHLRVDESAVVTEASVDAYIDKLLDDERFAHDVAPQMLVRDSVALAGQLEYPSKYVLTADESSGTKIVYLDRQGKCAPKAAVDVHPWWALDTTIKVCPTSYQPTHLKLPDSEVSIYCGARADPYCGCGPNLLFCARDATQREEIIKSLQQEASAVVARAVTHDAALEQIWSVNETERDRNAEMVYRRWRISAGESPSILADLKDWPPTPVLAPRFESTPGEHAGLLTVSGALGIEDSIRARMKWFYKSLWCDEPPAGTVTTEAVLALKGKTLRTQSAGWERLAAQPICTDCHARLDYGGQFFKGYGVSFAYDPKEHLSGEGKLFGANIDDYRGTAPLDPHSFAKLATAQPEFSACVVKKVKRHVFEDASDTSEDGALASAFKDRHSLKSVMRVALRSYVRHRLDDACATSAPKHAGGETLEQMFGTCRGCHGADRKPDFQDLSDRTSLMRALDAVAFGKMPPPPIPLSSDRRRRLTELLIDRIWTDEPSRVQARQAFENLRPHPVHSISGVLNAVDARAGGGSPGRFPELSEITESGTRGDLLRYTPGVESLISLEALAACRKAGHEGAALESCVTRATDLSGAVRSNTGK